jgi:GDP/GTP exchange factor required for growth at low temperature
MHLLGEKFAAATRKSIVEDEDSDVDLDFLPDQATFADSPSAFHHDAANAHLNTAHVGAGLSPTRPASIPFSSFSILQRTDHAPGPIQDPDVPFVQNAAMPIHHSAFSRVFVKTIGRLGRWKRVLNSRAVARTSLSGCTDVSAFDLELGVSRDLLAVNGGVEDYLAMAGPRTASSVTAYSLPPLAASATPSEAEQPPVPCSSPPSTSTSHDHASTLVEDKPADRDKHDSRHTVAENADDSKADQSIPGSGDRPASFQSSSTDSFGSPLASGQLPLFRPLAQAPWQFDVVSIDDLEFSDTSSDYQVVQNPTSPSGLRRQPRKLPLRRDFEFVRRETVSSLGNATRESVTSNVSSVISSPSGTGLGGGIAQWQLNSLVDSLSADEEAGDVEDALRRLEGQLNPEKQQEKASKVDGWVRTMRERMAAGNYVDEPPRFLDEDSDDSNDSDDEELRNDSFDSLNEQDSASQHEEAAVPSIPIVPHSSNDDVEPPLASTPISSQTPHFIPPAPTIPPANPGSPSRTEAKPAPEDAVPLEILQSRVPSRPSTASSQKAPVPRFTNPETTRVHRSWILGNRTAVIANHFAMIDRELFMCVKFDELIVDDWIRCEEVNVLDWSEYLNDRARWRAESRFADKTTALAAVRGRFNLMANFIISEIVLTQHHERPALVAKFIRIAWVSPSFRFSVLIFQRITCHTRNHTSCVTLLAWLPLLLDCKANG